MTVNSKFRTDRQTQNNIMYFELFGLFALSPKYSVNFSLRTNALTKIPRINILPFFLILTSFDFISDINFEHFLATVLTNWKV